MNSQDIKSITSYITNKAASLMLGPLAMTKYEREIAIPSLGKQVANLVPVAVQAATWPLVAAKEIVDFADDTNKNGVISAAKDRVSRAWETTKAVGDDFKKFYADGKFLENAYNDPARVATDVASVVSGTGAVVNAAGKAGKVAELSKLGQTAMKVGTFIDPLSSMTEGAREIAKRTGLTNAIFRHSSSGLEHTVKPNILQNIADDMERLGMSISKKNVHKLENMTSGINDIRTGPAQGRTDLYTEDEMRKIVANAKDSAMKGREHGLDPARSNEIATKLGNEFLAAEAPQTGHPSSYPNGPEWVQIPGRMPMSNTYVDPLMAGHIQRNPPATPELFNTTTYRGPKMENLPVAKTPDRQAALNKVAKELFERRLAPGSSNPLDDTMSERMASGLAHEFRNMGDLKFGNIPIPIDKAPALGLTKPTMTYSELGKAQSRLFDVGHAMQDILAEAPGSLSNQAWGHAQLINAMKNPGTYNLTFTASKALTPKSLSGAAAAMSGNSRGAVAKGTRAIQRGGRTLQPHGEKEQDPNRVFPAFTDEPQQQTYPRF